MTVGKGPAVAGAHDGPGNQFPFAQVTCLEA